MLKKVFLSGLVVSIGMLLGRLMGFVREASIASIFGVSSEADIAVLVLTVPDILVSLLVAGGLSAALIPEFKSLSSESAKALFMQVSVVMGVFFILLVAALFFCAEYLVFLFAPGLSNDVALSAQNILSQVLWLIPITVLAGITTAYLQSQGKFMMPALGTFIFNASVVIGLIWFVSESKSLAWLVYFIILGGLLRWATQLWVLRHSLLWRGSFDHILVHKALLWRYGQAVVALGLLTLFPVVARAFASFSGEGGVAMMNYAWRLVELPLGLVITVLAVVMFPKLSEMHANADEKNFVRQLQAGLFWSLVMAAAIMGPILSFPEVFVSVVYQWGENIPEEKLAIISELLRIGIMILPFQAVIAMSMAAFNAKKNTKFPMKVGMIVFCILLPLCWWAQYEFGLLGTMWAILLAYVGVSAVLLYVLQRTHGGLSLLSLCFFFLVVVTGVSVASYIIAFFQFSNLVNATLFLLVMILAILSVLLKKGGYSYICKLQLGGG